jgi:TorA maturation chaperone TorD
VIEPNLDEWQQILTGEILLYNFLGRAIYKYPDDKERSWLQSCIDDEVFSEVPFSSDNNDTQIGLKYLQRWQADGLTDTVFEQIQSDYTRLFIGPGKVLAPPWESVYFNEERMTFQKQTLDVRHWYRRFGIEIEKLHQEPDDHIGLELLFMAQLASLCLDALNEHDTIRFEEVEAAQGDFLNYHLGIWALSWCKLVQKHAETDFYPGLAYLTYGGLTALADVLNVNITKGTV